VVVEMQSKEWSGECRACISKDSCGTCWIRGIVKDESPATDRLWCGYSDLFRMWACKQTS
jgi:hypothetical protein